MSKWEDTVKLCGDEHCQPYCHETQAEISFKAGREEERAFILQNTDRDKRARLEGIREVVEWIGYTNEPNLDAENTQLIIPFEEWQAKLKDWGV